MIKCEKCGSMLVFREGKFGIFAGCTNYPTCSNTIKIEIYKDKLSEIFYDYLEKEGINIYCWDKECWKCHKTIKVMTYFLAHQIFTKFPEIDDISKFHNPLNLSPFSIGLGDILELDKSLEKQYPTIKPTYSSTRNRTNMSNVCEYCKALQGRNYVVDDPHEIMGLMLHEPEKFDSKIISKIKPSAIGLTRNYFKQILLSNLE